MKEKTVERLDEHRKSQEKNLRMYVQGSREELRRNFIE
jgi:hypothetical protein